MEHKQSQRACSSLIGYKSFAGLPDQKNSQFSGMREGVLGEYGVRVRVRAYATREMRFSGLTAQRTTCSHSNYYNVGSVYAPFSFAHTGFGVSFPPPTPSAMWQLLWQFALIASAPLLDLYAADSARRFLGVWLLTPPVPTRSGVWVPVSPLNR